MGIPKLYSHLKPFAVPIQLGCRDESCEKHRRYSRATVDGPGLAYYIYYKLLAQSPPSLNLLDAKPSYKTLGEGLLTYLAELENHNITIDTIYFDGYLPESKKEIRRNRRQHSLKQLAFAHASNLAGIEPSANTSKAAEESLRTALFGSKRKIPPYFDAHIAPPYLVPALIEVLSKSRYGEITRIVPDEADLYCARVASNKDCLILTSDSDLLLYDMERESGVCYFDSLYLTDDEDTSRKTGEMSCEVLRAAVSRPHDIMKRLKLPDLRSLAFMVHTQHYLTLSEAAQGAATLEISEEVQAFYEQYETESEIAYLSPAYNCWLRSKEHIQNVDPRLSELVLQLAEPCVPRIASVYLPEQLEDPTKSSSWTPSLPVRALAYGCLVDLAENEISLDTSINEYNRKGSRVVKERIVFGHASDNYDEQCLGLTKKIQEARDICTEVSSTLSFWRLFALAVVCRWYLDSDRKLPSHSDVIQTLGMLPGRKWTWDAIHVVAQTQGVLYSLSWLRQAIRYQQAVSRLDLPETWRDLYEILKALPSLVNLMPSPRELEEQMSGMDVDKVIQCLVKILQRDSVEIISREILWGNHEEKPKKTKKSKEERQSEPPAKDEKAKFKDSKNMFAALYEDNI